MKTLQQVLLLTLKDLRIFLIDKGAVAFALGFPLIFAATFSLILPDADLDEAIRLRVATSEGPDGISHQIIEGFGQIPDIEVEELDPDDATRQVEDGDISAYLYFPADLTSRLFSGEPVAVQVVTEAESTQGTAFVYEIAFSVSRELSLSQAAVSAAVSTAIQSGDIPDQAEIAAAVAAVLQEGTGGEGQAIGVQIEQVGDIEPVSSANYVLPGYITMFLFFAAGFGSAELIRERRQHTFDRLVASGVTPGVILTGKWLGTAARALVQAAILWVAGLLFFGIDMGNSPVATILVTLGMLIASSSFTLFLATIAKTEDSASSITVLASLTMAALGGSWWPLFIMPEWMQMVARVTPHAWANDAFNTLLLFGGSFGEVLPNIAVLCLFGVVLAIFAAVRVRRQEG